MSQGIALEGMRLVKENLPHAFTNGDALEARANMMSAALMGAVAFQKGLGGAHALTHSVGAMYNTHHRHDLCGGAARRVAFYTVRQ